jgi:hypothetical protein
MFQNRADLDPWIRGLPIDYGQAADQIVRHAVQEVKEESRKSLGRVQEESQTMAKEHLATLRPVHHQIQQ